MHEFIWSRLLSALLNLLPNMILRRLIKPQNIVNDLEIDLRSAAPIQVYLAAEVPWFNVWLRFTNKSPLTVFIDRIVLQVWVGQPVIDGAMLRSFELAPKQTEDSILFESRLSGLQRAAFLAHIDRDRGSTIQPRLTLHFDVYGDCKIGRFHQRVTKELYDIRAEGIPASVSS